MSRLSRRTLDKVPASVARPGYDPDQVAIGVVHFGPGAFHRAHQAAYLDTLLETDLRWGIAAVSLRTREVVDALAAQDGLYSLTMLGAETHTRIIAAHRSWLAPDDAEKVLALLGSPDTRLVTMTVTEKGYCLDGDGQLDLAHPDIAHDLTSNSSPRSVIGWIVAGAALRRASDLPAFAVLCCDNMTDNGDTLRAATLRFADRLDPALAAWIEEAVFFPNTMVDSITPATDERHRQRSAVALGLDDGAAVQRETFTQWVIEEGPLPGEPDLDSAGVIRTSSVVSYERAKLRMLNGAHSTLAYLGIVRGHRTVAEAMGDPWLASFVRDMVVEDVVPTLDAAGGLDLITYADSIFERFRNPAIDHLLSQIAWDGSKKIPYRLLDTLADALEANRRIDRLLLPVAAWMRFIEQKARSGDDLVDPLSSELIAAASDATDAEAFASRLLDMQQIFPPRLASNGEARAGIVTALRSLGNRGET